MNQFIQRSANSNDGNFFLTVVHIQGDFNPYICAPNIRTISRGGDEWNLGEQGTRPPITNCFTSSFVGKSLTDCAEHLRKSPDGKTWSNEYFCALSEEDVGGDTVMLVRRFHNGAIHAFPWTVAEAARKLYTAFGDRFDEHMQMYKRITKGDGGEDRSIGEPFEYTNL